LCLYRHIWCLYRLKFYWAKLDRRQILGKKIGPSTNKNKIGPATFFVAGPFIRGGCTNINPVFITLGVPKTREHQRCSTPGVGDTVAVRTGDKFWALKLMGDKKWTGWATSIIYREKKWATCKFFAVVHPYKRVGEKQDVRSILGDIFLVFLGRAIIL